MPKFKILGVINITPNSFSDGGKYLDLATLKKKLLEFQTESHIIPDIGFESTAPMNSPITYEEEIKRFSFFLEFLDNNSDINFKELSFDTYRPKSFTYFSHEIKKRFPQIKLIMNDVSGVLDNELKETLSEFPDCDYVFTFTRIPDRMNVLNHMKFLDAKESDISLECAKRFNEALQWFRENNLTNKILFDPGFGFSKSYEENWYLIDNISSLLEKSPKELVIGLSRKSFLKKKSPENYEELHLEIIHSMLRNKNTHFYFRVHDPKKLSMN